MTAVVLAAGRGTRLRASDPADLPSDAQRETAAKGLKAMMPVGSGGRRWIDYVIDGLVQAGGTEIVVVVAADSRDIETHLADRRLTGVRVRFAVQSTPDGTAGAVLAAAPLVNARRFLVVNGDTIYPVAAVRTVAALDDCGLGAFTRDSLALDSGFGLSKIAAFALVDRDSSGWLTGLCEKPSPAELDARGPSALLSLNLWTLCPAVFDACRDVPLSTRGERELPAAVMLTMARGTPFRVIAVGGRVFDLTTAGDVPLASRALADAGWRP